MFLINFFSGMFNVFADFFSAMFNFFVIVFLNIISFAWYYSLILVSYFFQYAIYLMINIYISYLIYNYLKLNKLVIYYKISPKDLLTDKSENFIRNGNWIYKFNKNWTFNCNKIQQHKYTFEEAKNHLLSVNENFIISNIKIKNYGKRISSNLNIEGGQKSLIEIQRLNYILEQSVKGPYPFGEMYNLNKTKLHELMPSFDNKNRSIDFFDWQLKQNITSIQIQSKDNFVGTTNKLIENKQEILEEINLIQKIFNENIKKHYNVINFNKNILKIYHVGNFNENITITPTGKLNPGICFSFHRKENKMEIETKMTNYQAIKIITFS